MSEGFIIGVECVIAIPLEIPSTSATRIVVAQYSEAAWWSQFRYVAASSLLLIVLVVRPEIIVHTLDFKTRDRAARDGVTRY